MKFKNKVLRSVIAAGLVLTLTTGLALASIGTGVVTADSLRLRGEANTGSAVLANAPKGSSVILLEGLSNGWYKVDYKGTVGYMSADWLNVTLSSSQPEAGAKTTGTVNTASLNVRSGPGITYNRTASLKRGSVVTILDDSSAGWYRISWGSINGYVSAEYITVSGSTSPDNSSSGDNSSSAGNDTTSAAKTGTVNTASLNVRSGPGTGYSRVGSLKRGATVTITGSSGSWYQITGGSLSGFVSAEYITVGDTTPVPPANNQTITSTPSEDSTGSGSTVANTQGRVNTASLNVRSGPGTGYGKVGTLKKGATVTIVTDAGNGWYQITSGSLSGYVSADYISFGTSGETQVGLIITASLNVRSGPGTGYGKVGSVRRGTTVTILADSGSGWYQIRSGSLTGYVSADYVTIMDGAVDSSSIGTSAAAMAISLLGCRYVYGAEGPNTFDCSGLFYYIFRQLGHPISRTSSSQYRNDGSFVSSDNIQPGDLVFFFDPKFDGSGGTLPTTHVGMYVGNNQFIHASTTSYKVQYDMLYGGYYGKYIVGFKRIG